jgi:methionine sulfoxide reductase heme-binding subunit
LTDKQIQVIKAALFLLCLWPLGHYVWSFKQDALGANPIEAVTRGMGTWALQFLLVTLTVTPLRKFTRQAWLGRLRRMLGLFAFFYASLHLTTYLWFDQFFDWPEIAKDIVKRPFITAGMVTFLLLVPLAATSTNAMIRRLGGRRWQRLHRLVYPVAMIALLHYTWMVKADVAKPLFFSILLAILLGLRLWWHFVDAPRLPLQGRFQPGKQRVITIQPRR